MSSPELKIGDFIDFHGDPALVKEISMANNLKFVGLEHIITDNGKAAFLLIEQNNRLINTHIYHKTFLTNWWRYMNEDKQIICSR